MPGLLDPIDEEDNGAQTGAPDPSAQDQGDAGGSDDGSDGSSGQSDAPDTTDDAGGGPQQASPEEQQQYNKFVGFALKLIYDQQVLPQILASLKATNDPLLNLANTTVMVVRRVEDAAEKGGEQISSDVLMHGGLEILTDLAELADKAKIHTYSQKEIEGAYYRALDQYRQQGEHDGSVDPGALKSDFAEILNANQEGKLNDLLPGVDQAAKDNGGGDDSADASAGDAQQKPPSRGLMQ